MLLQLLATDAAARAIGLRAIHVDHGLHPQSGAWAAHCRQACAGLGIGLSVVRASIDPVDKRGPEGAAREARHRAFEIALEPGETLVLAHHRDDQAETFLLRALRASGPDGLASMRPWRAFGRGWLWRPLLDVPRSALLAHARERQLRWIEDPSNRDDTMDRNFLRSQVLPLLRARWPQADQALARSASLCADAAGLLAIDDARLLEGLQAGTRLDAIGLHALPPARRSRVLRRWIESLGLPPLPAQGVTRIEGDLLDAAPDANACFAWSGAVVHRWRDGLHADWSRDPLPASWEAPWDGRAPMSLPGAGMLLLTGTEGFDPPVRVTARRGGERITLAGRPHSHALKQVLQDVVLPPWERERLPLLWAPDGELLAAGDVAVSGRLHAWLQERGARLAWSRA